MAVPPILRKRPDRRPDKPAAKPPLPENGMVERRAREPTAERHTEIREMYANGETLESIAKTFRISQGMVYAICTEPRRQKIPEDVERNAEVMHRLPEAEIRERYSTGETLRSIARHFQTTLLEVEKICKRAERPTIARRNAEIRRRYAEGEKVETIAKAFGISRWTVSRICRRIKRKTKTKKRRRSGPEKQKRNAEIRRRYAEGEKVETIAKSYGISNTRISQICKGIERRIKSKRMRKPDPEKQKRNAEIRKRYSNGENTRSIAETFGISSSHVYHICRGVERKTTPDQERQKRNAEIGERFIEGESPSDLAKDFSLSVISIYAICRGLERKYKPKRTPNPRLKKRNAEIRRRYSNGENTRSIADDFGIPRLLVFIICKDVD